MVVPLVLWALTALALATTSSATVYTVGDSAGWDISADLFVWKRGKSFYVGDALLFQYNTYQNLYESKKEGYDTCSTANAVKLSDTTGNTTVPLTSPGHRYFMSGVLSYCLGGMKLDVNVQPRSGSAPIGAPVGAPATPFARNGGFTSSGSCDRTSSLLVAWTCSVVLVLLWMVVI